MVGDRRAETGVLCSHKAVDRLRRAASRGAKEAAAMRVLVRVRRQ